CLQGTVALIPPAWQYPEITEGRITFEKHEFMTEGFTETRWQQAADIIIHGRTVGAIKVCYTKEMPEQHEGPFLKEERSLIQSMANRISDIIQLKQSEKELQAERWRLKSILKSTNVGTWEWNIQTGETVFNERWAEIIGYTLDEISPVSIETWKHFAESKDLEDSDKQLEKHFKGEREYYEIECRMKHKDGYFVWVLDRGKVFAWTNEGEPLMMFGTHQDITARKRVELSLRKTKERYQQLSQRDGLTGVLNRRGWNECLAAEERRAKRYGNRACVVVVDLDGLKLINDTDGHKAGDALIQRTADAISDAVRDIDSVARTGGDEFAVLGLECDQENADVIVGRIASALTAQQIDASWGVAVNDSRTALKDTFVEADRLMYKMKAEHRTIRECNQSQSGPLVE
ncbi:MAG: sensor domain-containing diguanylate cyclase, partial [Candidatus Electrothrix sp. AR3]|nr:sensor domain-containing diguanylate cyclase [Candidatus Electrothrix sp. AR3]